MTEEQQIDLNVFYLGTCVVKFNLPIQLINNINKAYDENLKNLKPHNNQLAGKIAEENKVDEILNDDIKNIFQSCFVQYLNVIQKSKWNPVLSQAWINEMKSGEYNPLHYHTGVKSEVGLSSVLMLKRPNSYGVEASREERPANGWLQFTGGDQSPLGVSQIRADAQVGEFYVFPYSLLHGVYPFNGTDEVRRTLSYNCDLIKKGK
jgi:hypothetical protein|tara:strand:+ start:213 stop:830 length:618 start_codon:yes stop_codon:yes gene_type:complete